MSSIEHEQARVATACRILARRGLIDGALGHISVRHGDGMLLRARGPSERGVLFTAPEDIVLCDLAGQPRRGGDHRVPSEHHLHGVALRTRPKAGAVVHAHPPAVLACDLAGVPLAPVFGAYNIPAARLARAGIARFPHPWLIDSAPLAEQVLETMGRAQASVLAGHGVLLVGATLEEAIARALDLEALARVCLSVAQAGGRARLLSEVDFARLPNLGSAFNDGLVWAHEHELDRRAGLATAGGPR